MELNEAQVHQILSAMLNRGDDQNAISMWRGTVKKFYDLADSFTMMDDYASNSKPEDTTPE